MKTENIMRITIKILILSIGYFVALGQDKHPLKTTSISIFRDGNAFFIKKATLHPNVDKFVLLDKQIPEAKFGSLWFSAQKSTITSIKSHLDTITHTADQYASSIPELLSLNQGKKIKLKSNDQPLQGIIKKIKFQKTSPTLLHLLTDDQKWLALNTDHLSEIEFYDSPPIYQREIEKKETRRTLEVKFAKNNTPSLLHVMYLQSGLSWDPFYYLEILDDKKVKITLRAEVINNAEDVLDANINFVVGKSNFKYAGRLAGLVQFYPSINPVLPPYKKRGLYEKSKQDRYALMKTVSGSSSTFENQLIGEQVEDHYFYSLTHIDLPKYARAHFELFSVTVNYIDKYECDLTRAIDHNTLSNNNIYNSDHKVYHGITIYNNSNNPFAEAPVFIVKNGVDHTRPLAQDLMSFTPQKGDSWINLNESREVKIKNNEIIIKKDKESLNLRGRFYHKATVKGTITISSYKNEPLLLVLRNTIQGELKHTDMPWEILWQKAQSSINVTNFVQWNIPLEKKSGKSINYEYEVYVNR